MPTLVRTFGWTIPHPPSSSHPVRPHVLQPAPLQNTHVMSYSAEGSVKGKYEGRSREEMSPPK